MDSLKAPGLRSRGAAGHSRTTAGRQHALCWRDARLGDGSSFLSQLLSSLSVLEQP